MVDEHQRISQSHTKDGDHWRIPPIYDEPRRASPYYTPSQQRTSVNVDENRQSTANYRAPGVLLSGVPTCDVRGRLVASLTVGDCVPRMPSSGDATVVVCAAVFCSTLCFIAATWKACWKGPSAPRSAQGYLLHTSVTHARYLPVESKHAFTYPALYVIVSLKKLESNGLDCGYTFWGWAFGYRRCRGRVMAIDPSGYLKSGTKGEKASIFERLAALLQLSFPGQSALDVEDAWMLTMPSCFGWQGINPLTVYFVYTRGSEGENAFSHVVLEVHNTFGEGHAYVLTVGIGEDTQECRSDGYDHQWTFARQFHVSPFNDRSGYYTVAIKRPTHPPFHTDLGAQLPRPTVRVQLYTEKPQSQSPSTSKSNLSGPFPFRGQLKLTAILRPTASEPLSSAAVAQSLVKVPFDLFLTMPRILYQAWILHYGKPRLDVYLRPEMKWTSLWRRPRPVGASGSSGEGGDGIGKTSGGGVMWLGEGLADRYARCKVEEFLKRRVDETGIRVTCIPANPAMDPKTWVPKTDGQAGTTDKEDLHLRIWYFSSKLFTTLLLSPSADYALLLGCDTKGWFQVSSRPLFRRLFCSPSRHANAEPEGAPLSKLQMLRVRPIAKTLSVRQGGGDCLTLEVPPHHFLDHAGSFNLANHTVIRAQLALDALEKRVFEWTGARIVSGQEPWLAWERAAKVKEGGNVDVAGDADWIGSVRSP
ncbi:hypothetical protein NMY22_g14205 [Coprinellus aureogranulatus]|nr:hypothetical protein NMY22_g14205 [Coprinellus aureogranulatus]